jgi:hypothetical protein
MNLKDDYDSELQMFVDRAHEPDRAHLRFLRWLAEHSWLEHEPIGQPRPSGGAALRAPRQTV